nr:GH92 family glycosyl hydrolase [uncultured Draconibacterium sp.]
MISTTMHYLNTKRLTEATKTKKKQNIFRLIISTILFVFLGSCQAPQKTEIPAEDLAQYVNPFVGTWGDGNTYPGAVTPFGLVQFSPDTEKESWRGPSGYEYIDSTLYGFSMTHFNGTGVPDLGDFLIIPTVGKLQFEPGDKHEPDTGYMSRFSHETEKASPGYYSVLLSDYNVKAELTATERAGIARFTFPETDSANILIDLSHVLKSKVIWANLRIENNQLITGYHLTSGWAPERHLYFAARFSKPFNTVGLVNDGKKVLDDSKYFRSETQTSGEDLQFFTRYKVQKDEAVIVKIGLSAVSAANALENLDAEIPGWDFEEVALQARNAWNRELHKIKIEGEQKLKETFYTSLYHAFLSPNIYEDVNGEYRGFDQNIHRSDGFTNYTIFSLWDTYRAVHPLFNLIQAERNTDMVQSMLAHFNQSSDNLLPIWTFYNNENWCMIGYHAVSVIADAYLKGIGNFDAETAYQAIKTTAMSPAYEHVLDYAERGYVPFDMEDESVSKTLEYAYDDYCIAHMAGKLGKTDDYNYFMKRAMSYKNVFDPETKFMRGKDSEGNWREPFNPVKYEKSGDFTEASSWQYTWYVPQDVQGLINLMGGDKQFTNKLDSLFNPNPVDGETGVLHFDGGIGQYWHGNEPSHHIAYLYNYAGQPWKTQELVHYIMKTQYGAKPNSLCGNDDCGQMSAWYIFNTLGFYPVCPVNEEYVIGSPCAPAATVRLSNGSVIEMKADNYSEKNIYIQSMQLNGKEWNKTYIPFDEIKSGAKISYKMGPAPNKKWGTTNDSRPESISLK